MIARGLTATRKSDLGVMLRDCCGMIVNLQRCKHVDRLPFTTGG